LTFYSDKFSVEAVDNAEAHEIYYIVGDEVNGRNGIKPALEENNAVS